MRMRIETLTIDQIKSGYKNKDFTVTEIVSSYYDRIKAYDKHIKAFISLNEEEALKQAKVLDERLSRGETLGALGGIPVAIKDNISTKGMTTTCASVMLKDYVPPYDATVVKKIKEADGIIIGKTNMDEFAMGSSTENSAIQVTKNPWDTSRVPGGSSGGSAAALSAGFAPITIGSDTGGSIRQPAAFCSAVGLKPTYHLVSRYGLIAFASSLDQIGPFSKTVKDSALALEVLQGEDPYDNTTRDLGSKSYVKGLMDSIKGMKVGIPYEFLDAGLDQEIKKKLYDTIETLESLGVVVEKFSLPITNAGLSAYYIISSAEASSNLARFDGVRYGHRPDTYKDYEDLVLKSRSEGFGSEVKRRIMLGTYVLSSGYYDAYYKKAMQFRQKVTHLFKEAFKNYDLILSPTSPILPFKIGEKSSDPLEMYLADIYTVNINVAGLPALSLPAGFSADGLPIGLQFIADHYQEGKMLKVAHQLEEALEINNHPTEMEAL